MYYEERRDCQPVLGLGVRAREACADRYSCLVHHTLHNRSALRCRVLGVMIILSQ